jgi:hypothetical protein
MAKISSPTAMEAELPPRDGSYRGVYCANPKCGEAISLEGTWPLEAAEDGRVTWRRVAHAVTCPFCKTEATYPLQQVQTLPGRRTQA